MAQTFLVFDFGADEESAQQARHKVEGWKQGFRLDKKLLLKFDRSEASGEESKSAAATGDSEQEKGGETRGEKSADKSDEKPAGEKIQLMIRLDFSDHERLSYHRWLERIPSEAPFKDAQPKIIRQNDVEFADTAKRFDSLP
jgi:hypothetical protein